ncbi:helix-turn-helix domain-containing protein [Alloiococcus sp. CFN-8]|uniref:helix-turn-helix domain-containing protein n=1 Tax=Alloiococcus sp. CFN-8 TaxID=3416081 RepID=UPI003CF660FA
MNDFEKLYTVEDIANITGLTSRTIRNYLKNGSLEGKKIGGQWRFTMDNIEKLFNNKDVTKAIHDNKRQEILDFIDGVNTDIKGSIQICSIVDYYCDNKDAALDMSNKLVEVINNTDLNDSYARYSYDYIEKEGKARFTLFGNPSFIIKTLELLEN